MDYKNIQPFGEAGLVRVIIETPKGAQLKYTYNEEANAFFIKKALPVGMQFPLDFGFIPHTLAEDGDPLDALVLMESPAYPGAVAECRILGVLEASQKEANAKAVRNDRLIAVLDTSRIYSDMRTLEDIDKALLRGLEAFFVAYNNLYDKTFIPLGWKDAETALASLKSQLTHK